MKMLRCALDMLVREYTQELELWQVKLPKLPVENELGVLSTGNGEGIPVLKFTEAKTLLAQELALGAAERERSLACHDFEPEEEKMLSEIIRRKTGSEFVFITHYPAAKRPFYVMEDPANPEETLSFDLIFRGLEITTGGQRIHD